MLPLKPICFSVATGLTVVMAFAGCNANNTSTPVIPPPLSGIVVPKQSRVALVIGNAKYKEVGELANPVNDATDIAKALEKLGFEVTLLTNLKNKEAMQNAINNFRSQLRQGGVGLFYYAGHGIQVRGTNYLIPIGESLDYEANTPHRTLSLNEVVALMEEAKTQVNIIIIDACRNNPWYGRWYRATISNGLAAVGTPPRGTIIAYATKPGSVAKDGIGQRNSPFTSALLQYIQIPNLDVRFMFGNVIESVIKITKEEQEPWTEGNLRGGSGFYLNPQQSVPVSPPPFSPPPVTPSPVVAPQPAPPPQPRSTLISSTTGVDYAPLRELLQQKKWKEADKKNLDLMLAAAKREKEGWLDEESVKKFSCEDLRMIDREWLDASGGQFGFSVQLAIYKQTGNRIGYYDIKAWERFGDAVGWRVNGNWKKYPDLTWSTNAPSSAPKGHLPARRRRGGGGGLLASLLSRCGL
ncbi:GUN4 domain-containing protein [Microcystis aeruginosa BLCCF158]|uniref:GUN4 domain-containing protein n=1 Tax=Microcystis aeruginosa BLCC-F158 TaxID=2755316 RepID=A0A841UUH9_MICAE|nr:GUN4 domain-containing protein [Microcystis aeruginosa]MBC1193798.1 GUN4 domain-containing protein [Microcystis aeruginosa BLCC-F158]